MKMILFNIIILFSILMLFLNHPLSMGLLILIQTLILSLILGMMMKTYWFSYILFITFLGGLLVLFIYVSSVASNELFKFNFNLNFIMIILIIFSLIFNIKFLNNLNFTNMIFNSEMNNFNEMILFNNENKINLSKLYNSQTFILMSMIIMYLFITLIAVVKITNIFFGALRSSN